MPTLVLPSLQKAVYDSGSGRLIASYAGPDVDRAHWLVRAWVSGPPFSRCDLGIGSDHPREQVRNIVRSRVDSTRSGYADYGSWDPPLFVPPGWWLGFLWYGGLTSSSQQATAIIEVRISD